MRDIFSKWSSQSDAIEAGFGLATVKKEGAKVWHDPKQQWFWENMSEAEKALVRIFITPPEKRPFLYYAKKFFRNPWSFVDRWLHRGW